MSVAQGQRILMVDADGATTFSELDKVSQKLEEIVKQNSHPLAMVVGSRRHMEEEGKVQRKFYRKFISGVFKFIITVLLGIKTQDTQCGFKLFTRESAQQLFETLHIERFAFDVELFFLCNKFKMETAEVAVEWRDVDGSKLNVLDASVNMFRDVLMIRFYYLIGLWKWSDKVEVQ
jgi:dolichyl-phosphate beta-glucosyltransferase